MAHNSPRVRGIALSLFSCHSEGIFLLSGDYAKRLKRFLLNDRRGGGNAIRLSRFGLKALCLAILLSSPSTLFAQFRSLETSRLQLIYYSPGQEYLAPHLARCFENALHFHSRLFDYHPDEKMTVFMQDLADYGNGGAECIPKNLVYVVMPPFPHAYEIVLGNERMNWLMNHELAHVVTMDQSSSRDRFFRGLFFGKVYPDVTHPFSLYYSYLTAPRRYAPRWYHEGSAVFLETWMAGGLGRALSSYYEMVFRTMVRDSSYFYDVVGLESEGTAIDFQMGANSYLYGTRFMSYIGREYGPEKLMQWLARREGTRGYFASQFKNVFGLSLDHAWSQWIAWEHEFQRANLDSLRAYPLTQYRPITRNALGSISRSYYDATQRKLYAAINYPGEIPHLAAIDVSTGAMKKICDLRGASTFFVTSLAFDPTQQKLFYATKNNAWRDLCAVDLKTGETRTLLKAARIGDLAFNRADSSLWGIRHSLGLSTLVRVPYPYREWNQVVTFPYGQDVYDLALSPDGNTLTASRTAVNGRQRLVQWNTQKLLRGDSTSVTLFDFEFSSPENFSFSPDGKFLFGSSYYSGVSNIYRYDFARKEMEIVSNAETGFFRPVPVSDDSLIAMSYTGKGFLPVMLPNRKPEYVNAIRFLGNEVIARHPVLESWKLPPPSRIALDSSSMKPERYGVLANTRLNSIYPIIEGYKDFPAGGVRLKFGNPLRFSDLSLTASYSPQQVLPADERLHLGLDFRYWQFKFRARYNGGDFYDLFGPTKRSRKGYSAALQYDKYLAYDESGTGSYHTSYHIELAGYGGLERLPQYQNVAASFDKAFYFNAGFAQQALARPLGAVEFEKGVKWQLLSETSLINEKVYPHFFATLDHGTLLPLAHSSLWLRAAAGYSPGERNEPFANFYFGGFSNNWIDHLPYQRFRAYESFPGAELNEIGGTNFGKLMLEWTLPPLRFRRVGIPTLYCRWARLALFTTALATNLDNETYHQKFLNAGGQLDFNLVLFSNLNSTLSFGYAAAFAEQQRARKELMVSLKIF